MNVTQSKGRNDVNVYTFTEYDSLAQVAERVFDLTDDVCRLSLGSDYVKLNSAEARQAWAAGVTLASRDSEKAMDALNIIGTYLRAEKDDLLHLDDGLASRLDELPAVLRSEVGWMVDAIRRMISSSPSSPPPAKP